VTNEETKLLVYIAAMYSVSNYDDDNQTAGSPSPLLHTAILNINLHNTVDIFQSSSHHKLPTFVRQEWLEGNVGKCAGGEESSLRVTPGTWRRCLTVLITTKFVYHLMFHHLSTNMLTHQQPH